MSLASDDWEEHTEIVPRVVVARRRRASVFLAVAAFGFTLGALSFVIPPRHRVEQATRDAIAADAQQLAVILHAAFNQTVDRAEGFAGTPVLEAGILTDAATVADIVKTEYRLKTRPGETLELFQLRGDFVTSLVRVPADAPAIPFRKGSKRTRIENRNDMAVVVTAEVAPYDASTALSGELAVAAPVDVSHLTLATHTLEANVIGAGAPIPLVKRRGSGDAMIVPIPLEAKWVTEPLVLYAVPVMTAYRPTWVLVLRYVGLALGVALLSTFAVGLRSTLGR